MAARKPTLPAEFLAATSADPRAPTVLTDDDRAIFDGCITDGRNYNSLPLERRYLRLFRRAVVGTEVWSDGATHWHCKALIDTSQLPVAWADDRTIERPASALVLLHFLWVDLLKRHGVKVKVSGSAGASCGGSFAAASLAKCTRLVEHHQRFIGDAPPFLGAVADAWLLPTVQGLLALGEHSRVVEFGPRLMRELGRGRPGESLAGLRILCDAYAKGGWLTAGDALLSLTPETLDALRPDLLPPFDDGRGPWFRAMPVRAWGQAMASLARLRVRAGNVPGAREAVRRALSAAEQPDDRALLLEDPELGILT